MTSTLPSPRVADEPESKRPQAVRPVWAAALLAGLLTSALRWWVGRDRVALANIWDEGAHLAIARTLAGDEWSTRAATYRPGLGTLLAPVHWVVGDPSQSFRVSLAVTAVLAGGVAALLVLLAARVTSARLRWIVVGSLVASMLPGTLLQGLWVTPESLISLLVVGTLLAIVMFEERPNAGRGLVVAVLPGLGFATHGRLAPLLVAVVLVLVVMVAARQVSLALGTFLALVAVASTAAAQVYAAWALDTVWAVTDSSQRFDSVLAKLGQPAGVLLSAAGMTWYQMVTTAGIVCIGAWAVGAALLGRGSATGLDLSRTHAAIIVVVLIPGMALSAVWMAGEDAPGHLVYGRYWDALLGLVVMLGVLILGQAPPRAVVQSAVVVWLSLAIGGAAFAYVRQDAIDAAINEAGGLGSLRRILSLLALTGGEARIDVLAATLVAIAIATGLIGLSALRVRSRAAGVGLAASLLVLVSLANMQAMRSINPDFLNRFAATAVVANAVDEGPAPGETIGIRWDSPRIGWMTTMSRWMAYQFYLPGHPIVGLGDSRLPPVEEPAFVFASPDDPTLVDAEAEVVWSHPDEPFALWRQPPE